MRTVKIRNWTDLPPQDYEDWVNGELSADLIIEVLEWAAKIAKTKTINATIKVAKWRHNKWNLTLKTQPS